MHMLSGPHDFLFLLCFIDVCICSCVSDIGVLLSLLIVRSILRYVLSVVCCIMLLNWLLNAFALCLSVVAILLLNCIVRFVSV